MHPLLRRQLKAVGCGEGEAPSLESFRELLVRIDRTYKEADQDRYTLERSLDISSAELRKLYEDLRQSSETALATTNAFLDSIVENIPDMIFIKRADNLAFERFNRAGEELIGQPREKLIGKTDCDFFPPEQAAAFQAADRRTLAGGVVHTVEEEPIHGAQGTRWLRTKKIPILDKEGRPTHLLGISADVTELKAAREQLERANSELELRVAERTMELRAAEAQLRVAQRMESVGRLAGGVAHDFNNVLAVVLATTSILLEDLPEDSPFADDVREIEKAGQRAAALTRQLLAFSRQQVLEPKPLDLNAMVADMEKMLVRLIGEDVRFVTHLSADLGAIEVDPSQLQQVILNLAVNARDAMPDGGTLCISTSETEIAAADSQFHEGAVGRHIVLTVTDDGSGMDESTKAKIFDPFFTTKEQGRGTGLGLATVYGIVKQSGGHITVASESGKGSSFSVYFPRVARSARLSLVPAADDGGGSETVLLVEDEEIVRRTIRKMLERGGYHVVEASNAKEALARYETLDRPIDLLISDVIMPGTNGHLLAQDLSARQPSLRVLLVSGYTGDVLDRKALDGVALLSKPFTRDALLTAVRATIEGHPPTPASSTAVTTRRRAALSRA